MTQPLKKRPVVTNFSKFSLQNEAKYLERFFKDKELFRSGKKSGHGKGFDKENIGRESPKIFSKDYQRPKLISKRKNYKRSKSAIPYEMRDQNPKQGFLKNKSQKYNF